MRLPKLVRKLWMPFIAILILALIATIELREPFQNNTTGAAPRPPTAPRPPAAGRPPAFTQPANCRANSTRGKCDAYGDCPAGFLTTKTGPNGCNTICHDDYKGGPRTCPTGSTRAEPNNPKDFRCMKPRPLKPNCRAPP